MQQWLRQIPNVISSLRILLVIPIAVALLHREFVTTMGLFAIAAASDALDGFLARHFGWRTALGAVLDPAADKVLLATVFVVLAILGLVPLWLMATAVARDVIIVVGAVAYRVCIGPLEARPSIISKLNTLCQALFILGVIGRDEFGVPTDWIVVTLGALTFVTTVISGIDYVLRYGNAAHRGAKSRRVPGRAGGSKAT